MKCAGFICLNFLNKQCNIYMKTLFRRICSVNQEHDVVNIRWLEYCEPGPHKIKSIAKYLEKTLKLKPVDIKKFTSSNINLFFKPLYYLQNEIEFLLHKQIKPSEILSETWLLNDVDKVHKNCELIEDSIFNDISTFFPLLKLKYSHLRKLINVSKNESAYLKKYGAVSRIHYLSSRLQVDLKTMAYKFASLEFLSTLPIFKIETMTEIMLKNSIPKEAILFDLWLYKHSEKKLSQRMKTLNEYKICNIRPWMFRAPEKKFRMLIECHKQTEQILGFSSNLIDYYSYKLNYERSLTERWLNCHQQLNYISLRKLDAMFNFMYGKGFSPLDIIKCPRSLCSSLATIERRYNELQELNYAPIPLYILAAPNRYYKKSVELIKMNVKNQANKN